MTSKMGRSGGGNIAVVARGVMGLRVFKVGFGSGLVGIGKSVSLTRKSVVFGDISVVSVCFFL